MSNDKSTVKEAAEKLQVHYQTVRNMINDGRLDAEKTDGGGAWLVDNSSIRKIQLEYAENTILTNDDEATINGLNLVVENNHKKALKAVADLSKVSKDFSSYYESNDLSIAIVQGVIERMKQEISAFEVALNVIDSAKSLEGDIKGIESSDRDDFYNNKKDGVEK